MSPANARNVVAMHKREHGLDGMFGSLDVMKIRWELCPSGWKGQFQGRDGEATMGLEALIDYNLWFWHDAFGFPGTLNDINIWDRSSLFESFQDGTFSKNDFEFSLGGEIFNQLYCLVDGIYPPLSRFLQTISVPMTKIDRFFASGQEAFRKDVKRGFGVIQKKFHYMCRPVKMHHRDDIFYVVRACIAMHNMMVETRLAEECAEDATWYDCVNTTTNAPAPDAAERDIDASDDRLAARAAEGDLSLDNEVVDLDFIREYERMTSLPKRLRIVQRRWEMLSDTGEHFRLQSAAKRDMYVRRFGCLDGSEETPEDYDPLID